MQRSASVHGFSLAYERSLAHAAPSRVRGLVVTPPLPGVRRRVLSEPARREFRYQPFTASIGWYRAGSGTVAGSLAETVPGPPERLATPTAVLWPEHDPLFPLQWSDRPEEFFADVSL